MARRVVRSFLLALGIVSVGSAVALADDGPPRVASTAGPVRPHDTILRLAASGGRELVLFVGGFASDPRDISPFAALAARLREHHIAYFGADRDGAYDARGSIALHGAQLRDAVRRKVRRDDYERVHIVAHSMGGNVSDAAFEAGLSWRDNVDSYTAIDAPHRGSAVARAARRALEDPLVPRTEARELLRALGEGVARVAVTGDEPAIFDLATSRERAAPDRVRTVIVAVPNSELVAGSESRLRGAERWVVPVMPVGRTGDALKVGAHGLVLDDPVAREIVFANVEGHWVKPGIGVGILGEAVGLVNDLIRGQIFARLEVAFRRTAWTIFAIRAMSGTTRWPPR